MNTRNTRGSVLLLILLGLSLLGGGIYVLKPKVFHGETKRAEAAKDATTAVVQTTQQVDAAEKARSASASASVSTILKANSLAPDSPAKNFIGQEGPVALSKMESPDPMALLAAELRRSAVMEGRVDEARTLYEQETKKTASLQHERDVALAARDVAQQKQRDANEALAEAAAVHRAAEQQRAVLIVMVVAALLLWGYTKLTHLSPASLGVFATRVRDGENPINVLSEMTVPWIHKDIQAVVKQSAVLPDHPDNPPTT